MDYQAVDNEIEIQEEQVPLDKTDENGAQEDRSCPVHALNKSLADWGAAREEWKGWDWGTAEKVAGGVVALTVLVGAISFLCGLIALSLWRAFTGGVAPSVPQLLSGMGFFGVASLGSGTTVYLIWFLVIFVVDYELTRYYLTKSDVSRVDGKLKILTDSKTRLAARHKEVGEKIKSTDEAMQESAILIDAIDDENELSAEMADKVDTLRVRLPQLRTSLGECADCLSSTFDIVASAEESLQRLERRNKRRLKYGWMLATAIPAAAALVSLLFVEPFQQPYWLFALIGHIFFLAALGLGTYGGLSQGITGGSRLKLLPFVVGAGILLAFGGAFSRQADLKPRPVIVERADKERTEAQLLFLLNDGAWIRQGPNAVAEFVPNGNILAVEYPNIDKAKPLIKVR